ncbi:LytR/AlgR family response regulator transcription factor [Niabella drilacis]|uniref:Two component transcriptional regulator, LytTR family n=1 Tax=Niabella drilacis (strain DSM 25811 / CCM 8410 / CCUG 62505 / LMG 26954 / E90) TaxID=1285928 RepID=A0A1G6SGA3_NIADE|nr:LytTR family DNA-binding domain-containing protein [Niabella drilacis]SDD15793.1 two component transcriptional regulator, LytTR family [Niabella drilacis]
MKAIIIEDEEIIAQVLQNKIRNADPSIEIIKILPSLKTAKKWFIQNEEPDILFMDIQLSDGVSFELLEHFQLKCPIVFTTAYDEFAIRAFKVNGVDYLLKPVNDEELQKAIDKCRAIVQQQKPVVADITELMHALSHPQLTLKKYKERFVASIRNQWMPIPVAEIAFFVKEELQYIYLFNGERYLLDSGSLDDIEDVLDPDRFYRANRQYIINIDAVRTVKPVENSKLLIRLKAPYHKLEIDMSRERAPVFKKWMGR